MKQLLFAAMLLLACSACSKDDDIIMNEPNHKGLSDHSNDAPQDENVIFAEE